MSEIRYEEDLSRSFNLMAIRDASREFEASAKIFAWIT